MQYTRADIMYDVKYLSINDYSSSESAFQGINHLIWYLYGFTHLPIMYPSGLHWTNAHDLRQEVSTGDFHYQKILNGLVDFADGG